MKYLSLPQQWVLLVIALLLFGSLCFRFLYHPCSPSSEELVREAVVEVSGEVRSPGVYLFKNPPTLREAVGRAGGLKESASFPTASSPQTLETGTLLIIGKGISSLSPSPPHPLSPPPGKRQEMSEGENKGVRKSDEIRIRISRMAADKCLVFSIPLDLNQVSAEDLCLIPGIGESLAREMIAYRDKRRGFRSAEDLKNVKGIGEKKYQNLKEFLTTR
jgi:competence protein ComEA